MNRNVLLTALAAAIALTPSAVVAEDTGKCYGVAKAGKNDCASAPAGHDCAHKAKTDNDQNEWVHKSKEECEKEKGTWKEADKG
jgi:uncharacterized membrane protein